MGWNTENELSETLYSKISEEDEEAHDSAFIAAFQALTLRMLHVWNKNMLLEIVNEVAKDVEKDDSQGQRSVCEICRSKMH